MRRRILEHDREAEPARLLNPNGTGDDESLQYTTTLLSAAPQSMACWSNVSVTGDFAMVSQDANVNNSRFGLVVGTSGTAKVSMNTREGATNISAYAADTVPSSGWFHMAGVRASSTSSFAYTNGKQGTEVTAAVTPTNVDKLVIGILTQFNTSEYTGDIFWPCFWNVALSQAEVAALAARTPPWEIRPESIVAMPNLDTLYDPFLGDFWTHVGSGGSITAPPFQWRPRRRVYKAPAAVGGLSIPVAMHHYTKNIGAA